MVLRQGLQFVVSVVLARLLTPADFGVMALLAFFSGFGMVVESGLGSALIQRSKTSLEQESALFWVGLATSFGIACVLVLSGPLIARLFERQVLQPLMWLAGAQVIALTLGVVPTALLTRAMRFQSMAKIALLAVLLSSSVAVWAAARGAGVWALGLQALTFTAANSLGVWLVSGWTPVPKLKGAGGRVLLGFSSRVGFSQLLEHLYGQGFALLIGKLQGVAALGLYNRGQATQYFASGTLAMIVRRIALPLFASRADVPFVLQATVKRTLQMSMIANLPIMVGLAISADVVVRVLFGSKWDEAAPIVSILALSGIFGPMQVVNSQLLLAMDRADVYWRTELVKKVVGISLLLIGSFFGVIGLAWSQVIFSVFAHVFNGHFTQKYLGYGAVRQLRDIAGVAAACAVMAAAVFLVRPYLDQRPLVLLASIAILGASIFLTSGLLLCLREFREAWSLLHGAVRKQA